jgi:hypothetical protein
MFGWVDSGDPAAMVRVLEEGDIFFCYRPKVDVNRVSGFDDVQRFYIILKPGNKPVFRRMIIGRKRLPGVEQHERTWGFVDMVTGRPDQLEDDLDPFTYETKTRGERLEPPARPAGEGVYAVADHDGHTHIAYALELPERPGPVQAELNIGKNESLIAAVRNPDAPPPANPSRAGLPASRRPGYAKWLREKFGARRFAPLDPPDFLDYVGAEVVLIGASCDETRELGLKLPARHETEQSAHIVTELGMEPDVHPLGPMLTGEWR